MQNVYLVRNAVTRKILNRKGGWSRNTASYRLAEFATKEAAEAAFPAGEKCEVLFIGNREEMVAKYAPALLKALMDSDRPGVMFFILRYNMFLDKNDTFCLKHMNPVKGASFDSESAALDKAEELGLDLDTIRVVRCSMYAARREAPVEAAAS